MKRFQLQEIKVSSRTTPFVKNATSKNATNGGATSTGGGVTSTVGGGD